MYPRFGKRAFDLFASSAALIALSSALLLIALLIRTFDPGPAIFRQERLGKDGSLFVLYKFRSMPVDTGDIPSAGIDAVRLAWTGRIIRRSNLDELPQLLNILKGDMSIVGPRPPLPSQSDLIEFRRENGALACRPGLTGWAQINSFDGMSNAEKARFDGEYAGKVSLAFDARIVLRTFSYLLKPPPKY